MKRAALVLFVLGVILTIGLNLFQDGDTAADYVRQYGGRTSTYQGILDETRCDRLPETWEVGLAMDTRQGTGIADAALTRYDKLGC